jgi:hypothetical protein
MVIVVCLAVIRISHHLRSTWNERQFVRVHSGETGARQGLFDRGDNAALTFGLQLVPRRNGGFTGRIRTHANAPQRALAGLQRLCICGITGALQATGQRVRPLVVGERRKLHGKSVM